MDLESNVQQKKNGSVLLVFPLDTSRKDLETNGDRPPKPLVTEFEGLMIPGPKHIANMPSEPEPLYKPPDGIKERMKANDSMKRTTKKLTSKVIFDITTPNPLLCNVDSPQFPVDLDDDVFMSSAEDEVVTPREHTRVNITAKTALDNELEFETPIENEEVEERIILKHGGLLKKCQAPYYMPASSDDTTLIFESRFESGNLRRATQIAEFEYDLRLNYDKGTRGHTQWFYFAVSNMLKGRKYKFNIVNLMKPDSLFNMGMRPLVYSEKNAREKQIGWVRGGYDICYYRNKLKREKGHYYTLTWTFHCENDDDTYFFAHHYPYTFSNLQSYLNALESNEQYKSMMKRQVMAKSCGENRCDVLTITSFNSNPEQIANRKGIIISARVHPGESNASFMMKGVIDFLLSSSAEASALRDHFVFKIVPMLNPDGVIYGNYRCNLAGADLNRKYDFPSKDRHPLIVGMKRMVRKFVDERPVMLFCDLHGHSRKKNIFMYGCIDTDDYAKTTEIKIFPKLLGKMSDSFSFKNCSFNLSKLKLNTGRIVMYNEMGIKNSFTMEASFCGPDHTDTHFRPVDLEEMGKNLLQALLAYHIDPEIVNGVRKELVEQFPPVPPSYSDGITSLGSDDGENSDLAIVKFKKLKHKKIRKSTAEKGTERNFHELTIVRDDDSVADDEQEDIKFTYEDITPRKKKVDATVFDKEKETTSLSYKTGLLLLTIFILIMAIIYKFFYE